MNMQALSEAIAAAMAVKLIGNKAFKGVVHAS